MSKVYKYISQLEHSVSAREASGIAPGERITVDMLENVLSSGMLTRKMNTVMGSLIVEENLWDEAMMLARNGDERTAFRASWGLEWAYNQEPEQLESRWNLLFEDFLASSNDSVHRVYSKMICDMLRRGAVTLSDDDAVRLAEKCFDLLIKPETAVAVKVWQIELLADLADCPAPTGQSSESADNSGLSDSSGYSVNPAHSGTSRHTDWIGEALTETVRTISESPDCTPAIAAHARHYFRRLAKKKRG